MHAINWVRNICGEEVKEVVGYALRLARREKQSCTLSDMIVMSEIDHPVVM